MAGNYDDKQELPFKGLTWSIGKTGFEENEKFLEMEKSKNITSEVNLNPDNTRDASIKWGIAWTITKTLHR